MSEMVEDTDELEVFADTYAERFIWLVLDEDLLD